MSALKSSYAFLNLSSSKEYEKEIQSNVWTEHVPLQMSVSGCRTAELQLLHSDTKYIEH